MSLRLKKYLLLLGDIALFFSALWLVVNFRYPNNTAYFFSLHFIPFSIILPVWLLIFYIAGLYEPKILKNNFDFLKTLSGALGIGTLASIAFLYLTPVFGITPRANLFLFLITVFILEIIWRQTFNLLIYRQASSKVILIGSGPTTEEIASCLAGNPQLGYHVIERFPDRRLKDHLDRLENLIARQQASTIVIPADLKPQLIFVKSLYRKINLNLDVIDTDLFYEKIFQKVPISEIEESWFLENITRNRKFYSLAKRVLEIILSAFLLILLSPLLLLIAAAVFISSPGGAIYGQRRVGRHEHPFTLFKFRSMVADAEADGAARWASPHDPRLTRIGAFLRRVHLDELPQLWNIFKGELSFVGPRPERPEFTGQLQTTIPFYELRHIVKPGVTGWAQINFRYGASSTDARAKLEYELYYIKHRSLLFDALIILRTLKTLFITPS